ncbi:MAG: NADH-quinone oxidoreductase subunit I [Planctomycetes bacterium]|nr:NADH-quinone oxidoreductase subunit I [Planctomycetota bacterium]
MKKFLTCTYLNLIPGFILTFRRMVMTIFGGHFTIQYPEEHYPFRQGFRGEHRLKQDELGRPKCVACLMCQTACPANCITIVATESPWPDREKVPQSFQIDLLRCIYCGMCEEACPCDAIELTPKHMQAAYFREDKVYDLTRLLHNTE